MGQAHAPCTHRPTMGNLLWIIVLILVVLWLGGFLFGVAGKLIHVLLVIAVIVLLVRVFTGRRAL